MRQCPKRPLSCPTLLVYMCSRDPGGWERRWKAQETFLPFSLFSHFNKIYALLWVFASVFKWKNTALWTRFIPVIYIECSMCIHNGNTRDQTRITSTSKHLLQLVNPPPPPNVKSTFSLNQITTKAMREHRWMVQDGRCQGPPPHPFGACLAAARRSSPPSASGTPRGCIGGMATGWNGVREANRRARQIYSGGQSRISGRKATMASRFLSQNENEP